MKILAIQNRMGIGDMVIFLPFVEAISKHYNSPITLLVKENSKANQYINKNSKIDEIITLKRDNKNNGHHDGFLGFFRLAQELKKLSFDKVLCGFNNMLIFFCKQRVLIYFFNT